jgi:hypothetical protein
LVGGASIVLAAPKRKQNEPRGARQVCAYLAPQPCMGFFLSTAFIT